MKKSPSHLRLVLAVWHDAWQETDNFMTIHGAAQTHKAMIVQTLGWVLVDNEEGIKIANERSADAGVEEYRGITFIPRGMVRSITEFKLATPKKKKAETVQVPALEIVQTPIN